MQLRPFIPEYGVEVSPDVGESLELVDTEEIAACFRSRGLVHFRGFGATSSAFAAFTERFGPPYGEHNVPYPESAQSREQDGHRLRSVTRGQQWVELHGEGHACPLPCHVLWFYCHTPAPSGGETTVCDGVSFFQHLQESTRRLLTQMRLCYRGSLPRAAWSELLGTNDPVVAKRKVNIIAKACADVRLNLRTDGILVTDYLVSAIVKTRHGRCDSFVNSIRGPYPFAPMLEDGSEISQVIVDEICALGSRLEQPISWKAGDFVMIDNTRMMHGRRPF